MENHNDLKWDEAGLLPAIIQDFSSNQILMLGWMNKQALDCTISEHRTVFWSRSRNKLWRKGEESGFIQHVRELRVDCDLDAILVKVEQVGGIACHTGRANCFFWNYSDNKWLVAEPVIKSPNEIYGDENE